MPLKNSCFISYRHPLVPGSPVKQLIQAIIREVGGRLQQWPASFDEERLKPGYKLNQALAAELYHSACMVMIYTGSYFRPESPYCSREFFAMLNLEHQRAAVTPPAHRNTSLIIPIAFRDFDKMNQQIAEAEAAASISPGTQVPRIGINFEHFQGWPNKKDLKAISMVVTQIRDLCEMYDQLANAGSDCFATPHTFSLPTEADVKQWLPKMLGYPKLPGKEAA